MPIDKVGIELEGAWEELPPDQENVLLVEDGSVQGLADSHTPECDCECECDDDAPCRDGMEDCGGCHVCRGESCQEAVEDEESFAHFGEARPETPLDKADVGPWMENAFPHRFNKTCGMHVHVSFTNPWEYTSLQNEKFYRTFMRWARKKARQVGDLTTQNPRLKGDNRYCRAWTPSHLRPQLGGVDYTDSRYAHLNFCWAKHGTLEFRLWGMTELHKARRLVKGTLDFVELWLARHAVKDDGETSEETEAPPDGGLLDSSEETVTVERSYACV